MREIPIFIASSVREFGRERLELSPFLDMLNTVYKRMEVQLVWNRPEINSRVMNLGGSQLFFEDFIRKSEFFVMIVSKSVGPYTQHEYEIALEQFHKTGKPKILPCFVLPLSVESADFLKRLRQSVLGQQYIEPYDNFDAVKNQLQWELANYILNYASKEDTEADIDRALKGLIGKINELQTQIERLNSAPMSPATIAELTQTYEKMAQMVRKYIVKPDALLDYMDFLRKQRQYDVGIKTGKWLESFYAIEPPNTSTLARLKYHIALSYHANSQYEQGKKYYLDALELYESLTNEFPSTYEQNIAMIFGNLGLMLEGKNDINDEGTNIVPNAKDVPFPYDGTEPYIFVSYKREEQDKVNELLTSMSNEGYRIWYDKAIPGSDEWLRSIAEHILNCRVFMLFISKSSVQSKYCSYEMKYAISNDKELFPVYLEETTLPPEWAILVSPHQSAKLFNSDAIEQFIEQLNQNKKFHPCRDFPENPEPYYQNALNIWQKLALDNSDPLTPNVAYIYNHIGILLQSTNHAEDSGRHYREALEKRYCQKALEIWRYLLVSGHSSYEADLATICNSFGNFLLYSMEPAESAERYYREALEIRRRLADANPAAFIPNVAQTCNNLGKLLSTMNRVEEAEAYYLKALEIRRSLAEKNPAAFEPYLAISYYNMGEFELDRGNREAAKQYFEKALSLYEKFPRRGKNAQKCRDKLAELQDA